MQQTMRRKRRTATKSDSLQRIAEEIEQLKAQLDLTEDNALDAEAEAIVKDDATVISEGANEDGDEALAESTSETLEQNEKSMDNWPVDGSATQVASLLVKCAKILLSGAEEIGDKEPSEEGEHEPEN